MTGIPGTRFGLLGPLEICVGGKPLPVLRPRQRAIAARLLLSANRYVATDQLIDDVWAGAEPVTARSQIQTDLAIVRRAIRAAGGCDPIATKSQGYQLSTDDLDLAEFRSAVARSESVASPADARCLVEDALGLWRGMALADVVAPYVTRMRDQIEEERLCASERLVDIELKLGRHAESIASLIELVTAHPMRQRFCSQLMLALHRSGRSAEALHAGREFRARLAESHGLDPGREVVMLERAILAEDPSLDYLPPAAVDVIAEVTPVAARPVPAQLPPLVANMVGRTAELERMSEALTETDGPRAPACVLAGVGGVGKTTLAIAWAHHHRHRYPDGQLFVDLRGYGSRPVPAVAAISQCLRALGVPNDRLPTEEAEAAAALRTKLDDRRVLLVIDNARSAEQVRSLLPASAGCAAIVTSRHHLGGLAARDGATLIEVAPLPQEDALRGYLYRGSYAHDLFTIGSVALAAADSVPVERQSWLRASARLTLSQAMFISGDADATAVCEAGLADAEQAGWRLGAGAFRSNLGMQRGRVGDSDSAVRHLSAAVVEARAAKHVLLEANSLGNLAGQRWSRGELVEAQAGYRALVPLFQQVGSRDGEAHAFLNLAGVLRLLGQIGEAREFAERSRAAFAELRDSWESYAIVRLAEIWLARGHPAEAQRFALEALAVARNRGLVMAECSALAVLGDSRRRQGDLRWAATYLERSHRLAAELTDVELISATQVLLGDLHLDGGDVDRAASLAEKADAHATSHKLVLFRSQAARLRAAVALRRGDLQAAFALCDRAIAQQRNAACVIDLERSLSLLAEVFAAAGQPDRSQIAQEEAAALRAMFMR